MNYLKVYIIDLSGDIACFYNRANIFIGICDGGSMREAKHLKSRNFRISWAGALYLASYDLVLKFM